MSDIIDSVNRKPFEWVEIDQSYCSLVYGTGSCNAILGTTGGSKCFNTRATCQDPTNYDSTSYLTLRFCHNQANIPDDYNYLPYLQSASVSAARINPGGGNDNISPLGIRSTLSCTFSDHRIRQE